MATHEALRGAHVQIFVAGRPAAEGWTDEEGRYSLSLGFDAASDATIFVACVPPGHELAAEFGLVRMSARARAMGLWGPCWPRVALDTTWDVTLLSRSDRRAELLKSGCWRDSTESASDP